MIGAAFDTACTNGITGDTCQILEERDPVGVAVIGSAVVGTDATIEDPIGSICSPGAKDLIQAGQVCAENRDAFVWVGEDGPVHMETPKGCSTHSRDEDGSTKYVQVPVINRNPHGEHEAPGFSPEYGAIGERNRSMRTKRSSN